MPIKYSNDYINDAVTGALLAADKVVQLVTTHDSTREEVFAAGSALLHALNVLASEARQPIRRSIAFPGPN